MAIGKTHNSLTSLVAVALCLSAPWAVYGASPAPTKLTGGIAGVVKDPRGVPQMGASVLLYNRQDRQIGKALTDAAGRFQMLGLFPALYSIKVNLASFVPAVKKDILVQPGMRSVLSVSLSTLFSSIQFSYPTLEDGSFMSDEWKWVLRGAADTRPVMRFQQDPLANPPARDARDAVFSDTRGILQLSAGEGALAGAGNQADLGTAFALATSVYGNSDLEVSGNLGYGSQTGVPATAFRTSYSRDWAGSRPVFSVTMRQLFLPERMGGPMAGSDASAAMLRSVSAGVDNRTQISDKLALQYGFTMDTVWFLERLDAYKRYVRLTYAADDKTSLEVGYNSGDPRPDLAQSGPEQAELENNLNTLGLFPRISLMGGRPRVQQGEEYEAALERKMGSRKLRLSAYHELLNDTALTMVAPNGMFGAGDLLPDLFSDSSIFNAGRFSLYGYNAAFTQNLGDRVSATLNYGDEGGLTTAGQELVSNSPDELRRMIRAGRRQSATARVTATAPWMGTRLIASYQWTNDRRMLLAGNLYSTQSLRDLPGLNFSLRQPIPWFGRRIEASADVRNALAQGYLPIDSNGARLLLVDNPRSLRGGLAFIF